MNGDATASTEFQREIILERPVAYNFESNHSKSDLGEKGAVSCCYTLAIVDRLHQIISRGVEQISARSPSPLPPHYCNSLETGSNTWPVPRKYM